jgi:hypothetical protein
MPVQAPTKYERVINSRTAKAIGIAVPQWLLLRGGKVIEHFFPRSRSLLLMLWTAPPAGQERQGVGAD